VRLCFALAASLVLAASAAIIASGEVGDSALAAWVIVIAIGCAVIFVATANGMLSPICVFVAVSGLYLISPAVRIIFENAPPILDPSLYFSIAYPLGISYLIAAIVGYQVVIKDFRQPPIVKLPTRAQFDYGVIVGLLIVGAYCISAAIDVGGMFGAGRVAVIQSVSTSTRVLSILSAGAVAWLMTIFIAGRNYREYRRYGWLLIGLSACAFAITTILLLGERRLVLSALAAFIVAVPLSRRVKSTAIVFAAPAIYALLIFSAFRTYPFYEWARIAQSLEYLRFFDISFGEFGAWATIAQDILSRPYTSVADLSFLRAPLSVIPSAIFPDRPLSPGMAYIAEFHPAVADIGGGMAFSIVLESYLNFWVFGPILVGGIFGAALAASYRSANTVLVVVFALTFSFRFDLVSLIQLTLWASVAIVLLSTLTRFRVKRGLRR
jgi:hypothetical protein